MSEVIVKKNDRGLATILLNRPKALNALNISMVREIKASLEAMKEDDDVRLILFSSTNERAFCAGGDIKALYEAKMNGENMEEAGRFFIEEYELDGMIYSYPKPIVANLDGIVMGGGVGLTYGAEYKIVTERTKWAMPEMHISFYPDVGASYFLNQAPGYIGRYIALTAKTFEASDVLYMQTANYYIPSEDLDAFLQTLEKTNWKEEDVEETMHNLLDNYQKDVKKESLLQRYEEKINEHFQYDTVEQIIDSLDQDDSSFAQETKKLLTSLSPISLKVTLELLRWAEGKTMDQCLTQDISVSQRFLAIDDFYEGARSVLIDKDRQPSYRFQTLEEVSDDLVQSFFQPNL